MEVFFNLVKGTLLKFIGKVARVQERLRACPRRERGQSRLLGCLMGRENEATIQRDHLAEGNHSLLGELTGSVSEMAHFSRPRQQQRVA